MVSVSPGELELEEREAAVMADERTAATAGPCQDLQLVTDEDEVRLIDDPPPPAAGLSTTKAAGSRGLGGSKSNLANCGIKVEQRAENKSNVRQQVSTQ